MNPEDTSDLEETRVLACRACLSTKRKLYPLFDKNELYQSLEEILGMPIFEEDNRPEHICGMCHAFTLRFNVFRKRCNYVQDLLESVFNESAKETMDYIEGLDRERLGLDLGLTQTITMTLDAFPPSEHVSTNDDKWSNEDNNYLDTFDNTGTFHDEQEEILYDTQQSAEIVDATERVPDSKKEEVVVQKEIKIDKATLNYCKQNNVKIDILDEATVQSELQAKKDINSKKYEYCCQLCGKGCRDSDALHSHIRAFHSLQARFGCEVCGARFARVCKLTQHKRKHYLRLTCGQCHAVFKCLYEIRNHMSEFHPDSTEKKEVSSSTCEYCGKVYYKSKDFYQHIRMAHGEHLTMCRYCGDTFNGTKGLQYHLRGRHKDITTSVHKCDACSQRFATSEALNRHITSRTSDGCSEHACASCGAPHELELLLRLHLIQHYLRGQDITEHTCPKCNTEFLNEVALKEHSLVEDCAQYHSCVQCGFASPARDALREHAREQHADRQFGCKCGKKFPSLTNLALHHERCGKTAKTQKRCPSTKIVGIKRWGVTLDNDELVIKPMNARRPKSMPGNNDAICEICGTVTGKSFMALHMRTHDSVKKYQYKCDVCGRVCKSRNMLREHSNVHTGERPAKCRYCDASFRNAAALQRHEYRHLNIRRHSCAACGKAFVTSTCVKQHIRAVHLGLKEPRARRRRSERTRPPVRRIVQEPSDDIQVQLQKIQQAIIEGNIEQTDNTYQAEETYQNTTEETYQDNAEETYQEAGVETYQVRDETYQHSPKVKSRKRKKEIEEDIEPTTQIRSGTFNPGSSRIKTGGKKHRKEFDESETYDDDNLERVGGKKPKMYVKSTFERVLPLKARRKYGGAKVYHSEESNTMGAIERYRNIINTLDSEDHDTDGVVDYVNGIPEDYGGSAGVHNVQSGGDYPGVRSFVGGKWPAGSKPVVLSQNVKGKKYVIIKKTKGDSMPVL